MLCLSVIKNIKFTTENQGYQLNILYIQILQRIKRSTMLKISSEYVSEHNFIFLFFSVVANLKNK